MVVVVVSGAATCATYSSHLCLLRAIRYSESLGFDSFTLPLNERDEASPPPTPPVRDASSLKSVCYGPGHEKYPSWPSAPERHPEEDIHSSGHSGSHRSKSWTDHTNYPKEKPAQYTRPHTKRPNPAFTQQVTDRTPPPPGFVTSYCFYTRKVARLAFAANWTRGRCIVVSRVFALAFLIPDLHLRANLRAGSPTLRQLFTRS